MRLFSTAALALTVLSAPAFADETTGSIVAFDRMANVIVLDDKSVWAIDPKAMVPSDLKAGDNVTLTFLSDGDNGAKPVSTVTRN